ncbi:unnamed protein product [Staurois parvus]|uniref:Uncharacterized protein n=1 Tax=Staurois parvus TaxID=386267 RepID=A0ABN9BJ60_9NEOB|nr:unnamed protein product [Staurois parvus]
MIPYCLGAPCVVSPPLVLGNLTIVMWCFSTVMAFEGPGVSRGPHEMPLEPFS